MPTKPCPKCQKPTARLVESTSKAAWVNYYRCDACGHVWNIAKDTPDGPIWHVTSPPKTPED